MRYLANKNHMCRQHKSSPQKFRIMNIDSTGFWNIKLDINLRTNYFFDTCPEMKKVFLRILF